MPFVGAQGGLHAAVGGRQSSVQTVTAFGVAGGHEARERITLAWLHNCAQIHFCQIGRARINARGPGAEHLVEKSAPVHFVGFKSFFLLRIKLCETFEQIVFMDKVSRLQSTIKKGSVCSNFGGYIGRKAEVMRFALSQSFRAPRAKLWRFGMYVFFMHDF